MSLRKKLCTSLGNTEQCNQKQQNELGPTLSSKYFSTTIAEKYIQLELELIRELYSLPLLSHVEVIYNPIEYAFDVHKKFVHCYLNGEKKILFLGLNPGPFGMGQTGVTISTLFCINK